MASTELFKYPGVAKHRNKICKINPRKISEGNKFRTRF